MQESQSFRRLLLNRRCSSRARFDLEACIGLLSPSELFPAVDLDEPPISTGLHSHNDSGGWGRLTRVIVSWGSYDQSCETDGAHRRPRQAWESDSAHCPLLRRPWTDPSGRARGHRPASLPRTDCCTPSKDRSVESSWSDLEGIGKLIHLYFEDPTGRRAKIKVLEMLRTYLTETDKQLCCLHFRRFKRSEGAQLSQQRTLSEAVATGTAVEPRLWSWSESLIGFTTHIQTVVGGVECGRRQLDRRLPRSGAKDGTVAYRSMLCTARHFHGSP